MMCQLLQFSTLNCTHWQSGEGPQWVHPRDTVHMLCFAQIQVIWNGGAFFTRAFTISCINLPQFHSLPGAVIFFNFCSDHQNPLMDFVVPSLIEYLPLGYSSKPPVSGPQELQYHGKCLGDRMSTSLLCHQYLFRPYLQKSPTMSIALYQNNSWKCRNFTAFLPKCWLLRALQMQLNAFLHLRVAVKEVIRGRGVTVVFCSLIVSRALSFVVKNRCQDAVRV